MADLDGARLELTRRIAALGPLRRHAPPGEIAQAVDEIRRIALLVGLGPAATVAGCIAAAVARGEAGVLLAGWLDLLDDAVSIERQDGAACDAFAAACAVRLAA